MLVPQIIHEIGNRLRLLLKQEHWFAEFWSGLVAVAWGVWSFTVGLDLHDFVPYVLVTNIFSAHRLEAVAVFIGLIQIGSLFYDRYGARGLTAFAACWFYSLFLLSFLVSAMPQPGVMFVGGWVGVNVFAVIRRTGRITERTVGG